MTPSDLRTWLAAMGYTNYRAAKEFTAAQAAQKMDARK